MLLFPVLDSNILLRTLSPSMYSRQRNVISQYPHILLLTDNSRHFIWAYNTTCARQLSK